MLRVKLFKGVEEPIEVYNGVAVIDEAIEFFTEECDTETDFTFPGYVSSYWRVYNERSGRLIKNYTLTQSGSSLIINNSVLDMTYEDNGMYYYEIGYVQTGGYEVPLRYGQQRVI